MIYLRPMMQGICSYQRHVVPGPDPLEYARCGWPGTSIGMWMIIVYCMNEWLESCSDGSDHSRHIDIQIHAATYNLFVPKLPLRLSASQASGLFLESPSLSAMQIHKVNNLDLVPRKRDSYRRRPFSRLDFLHVASLGISNVFRSCSI